MKCKICGVKLNNKTLRLNEIFDEREKKRIKKIKKNNGFCSECFIQMLFLDLI